MRDFSIKKLYYSISEVSKITEVEQYVLRYWETEFEELKPQKNRAGNRAYTNKDIQLILVIKHLLREKKYTIEGAKKIINESGFESLIVETSVGVNAIEETQGLKPADESPMRPFAEGTQNVVMNKKPDIHKELLELKVVLQEILKIL